ncbi:MAG: RagB/SusD family nutrient uptake outer membrane protein [Bacteroides sp.]|nr:RagB/SusD family nutrient uptake outer membrane protein [Bacteroides sp.]
MKTNTDIRLLRPMVPLYLLLMLITSCSDFLQEKVYDFYDEEEYYRNTEELELAVNGAYEVLSYKMTYGHFMLVNDCDTDLSHIKGSGTGHAARDIGHYNVYTEHTWLQEAWGLYYMGIDRVNRILANKEKIEVHNESDEATYHRLIAEARLLRGLCYFDLVRMWGDVPLKLTASTLGDNFMIPRTDREEVYDQIVEDMEAAIADLPWHDETGNYEGRMSKGAAMGLLARAWLFRAGYSLHMDKQMKRPANYKEYYGQVRTLCEQIIRSGRHSLNSSYEQVFRNVCEYILEPQEVMYEVQFYNPTGEDDHTGKIGSYNSPEIDRNSSYGLGNSFIKTTGIFSGYYDSDDPRLPVAIADFKIDSGDNILPIPYSQSYDWAPGKWRRNWVAGTPKDLENTDVNFILLRYADILLMYAEAVNETDGKPDDLALECINQVRRRAYGLPVTQPDATFDLTLADFPTTDSLREYLFMERARELCFEGFRRFDLIRWNLLAEVIGEFYQEFNRQIAEGLLDSYGWAAGQRFQAGKHELYPIPAYEIRETRGVITQNPGY